ncbi:hypothetical protein C4E04_00195 [Microvirga sp. 17 mud 1-3]|nr:hypothetical protein C4E04_00195 [Microvirga sp. 17 mud 1-3]
MAAQYLAADQEAHQPAFVVAAFLAFILFAEAFLFTTFLAQEVGEKHAADAPAPQYRAADQKTKDAALLIATLFAFFFLAVFLLSVLTPLAHEVSQEHTAHAPPAQQATGDQKPDDTAFIIASLLAFLAFILFVEAFLFTTFLAQEVGKQQAAHAPASQRAGSQRKTQDAAHVSFVLAFVLTDVFRTVIFILVLASFAQKMGEQQAAHALTLQHAAADQDPCKVLITSA